MMFQAQLCLTPLGKEHHVLCYIHGAGKNVMNIHTLVRTCGQFGSAAVAIAVLSIVAAGCITWLACAYSCHLSVVLLQQV